VTGVTKPYGDKTHKIFSGIKALIFQTVFLNQSSGDVAASVSLTEQSG
jgi:hypothetical protein